MARENDRSIVLSAALELANTQLLAQNEDEGGLDAQARALVAFDGAILGVMVAAKALVGLLWFLPLVATGSSPSCGARLRATRDGAPARISRRSLCERATRARPDLVQHVLQPARAYQEEGRVSLPVSPRS
jgi:hypothetical protein